MENDLKIVKVEITRNEDNLQRNTLATTYCILLKFWIQASNEEDFKCSWKPRLMFHMGNSEEKLEEISSVALLSPACFLYCQTALSDFNYNWNPYLHVSAATRSFQNKELWFKFPLHFGRFGWTINTFQTISGTNH